nr:MAG TPA_asm: hypothetical protein [Caudoviricetes sp.]
MNILEKNPNFHTLKINIKICFKETLEINNFVKN